MRAATRSGRITRTRASPAEPSQTDINLADYPDWLYLIVSLDGDPTVRAWWIRDRKVEEEALDVVD